MNVRFLSLLSASMLFAAACGDGDGASGADPDASSPPLGSGPYPIADLDITYQHPERSGTYQIGCQGDTATSGGDAAEFGVDPNEACEALADEALQQRLLDGPDEDRVCTQIFGGPDEAAVSGTLDGESVDTTFDLANGCAIDEWNDLAGPLLPAPYDSSDPGELPDPTTTTSLPGDEEGALGSTESCINPDGFTIRYPSSWATNDGTVTTPCSYFDPTPFDVPEGTDERVAAISAYVDPVPFAEVAAPGGAIDGTRAVTVVDGHQAVRLDGQFSDAELYPDGTAVTQYLIDLSLGVDDGRGTLFVDLVERNGREGEADRNGRERESVDLDDARMILDAMVATIDLDADGAEPTTVARYEGGGSPFAVTAQPQAIVQPEQDGRRICLQLANSDGSSCVTHGQATDGPPLRVVSLGDELLPVLAGTADADVFRIDPVSRDEPAGDHDALPSYLPVPIDGADGTQGWAFPFGRDRVSELVLYDIEGNEIDTHAVAPSDDDSLDPVGRFGTEQIESEGFPASGPPVFLHDVRVGAHDGFDRVVFEFTDGDSVSYRVELTESITRPSGQPADIAGEQLVSVTLTPASTVDLSGSEAEVVYPGPDLVDPDGTVTIEEVALASDFEATMSWGIGVGADARFAVELVDDPLRLVIDIGT